MQKVPVLSDEQATQLTRIGTEIESRYIVDGNIYSKIY